MKKNQTAYYFFRNFVSLFFLSLVFGILCMEERENSALAWQLDLCLPQDYIHLDDIDEEGNTWLHIAANMGDSKKLLFLHKIYKLNINAKNYYGQTPLHIAIEKNNSEIVLLLLEFKRLNINCQDFSGLTPLHIAIKDDKVLIAIWLLHSRGIDLNVRSFSGRSILHWSVLYSFTILRSLLRYKKIDLDAQDFEGSTPLHLAVKSKQIGAARLLLKAGAKTNIKDNKQRTPLIYAYDLQMIDLLIDFEILKRKVFRAIDKNAFGNLKFLATKITFNLTNGKDNNILHKAIARGNNSIIGLILSINRNLLSRKNARGVTPFDLAVSKGQAFEILELITKAAYYKNTGEKSA